jgi:chromosome partitioning protein
MGIAIAVAHAKGGAGKTSLTANLGYALAARGAGRVLVIDLDKQMSLTRVVYGGYAPHPDPAGGQFDVGRAIQGTATFDDIILRDIRPGLDLAPAQKGSTSQALDALRAGDLDALLRLRLAVDAVLDRYDYVLIDTPGEQGPAMETALLAADHALIPVIPERMCIEGTARTLEHIAYLRSQGHEDLTVLGLVFMRTGGNANIRVVHEQLARDIAKEHGVPILRNKVPTEAAFNEAEAFGQPVGEYRPTARTSIAFRELAEEISNRFALAASSGAA